MAKWSRQFGMTANCHPELVSGSFCHLKFISVFLIDSETSDYRAKCEGLGDEKTKSLISTNRRHVYGEVVKTIRNDGKCYAYPYPYMSS